MPGERRWRRAAGRGIPKRRRPPRRTRSGRRGAAHSRRYAQPRYRNEAEAVAREGPTRSPSEAFAFPHQRHAARHVLRFALGSRRNPSRTGQFQARADVRVSGIMCRWHLELRARLSWQRLPTLWRSSTRTRSRCPCSESCSTHTSTAERELRSSRRSTRSFGREPRSRSGPGTPSRIQSFEVGEECEALFADIEARGAYDLVDAYFEALCERLRTRLGIRVAAGSSEGELRYLLLDD